MGLGVFTSQSLVGSLTNGIEQKAARGQVNDIRLSPSSLLLMEAGVSRGGKGLPSAGSPCASHILSGTLLRWLSPEKLGQQRVAEETGRENGVGAAYSGCGSESLLREVWLGGKTHTKCGRQNAIGWGPK